MNIKIEKDIPIPRTKWETIRDYKWNHIAIIAKLNKGESMNSVKFRHLVSKVIIQGNASDNIVKEILEWMKETKPQVVHKEAK